MVGKLFIVSAPSGAGKTSLVTRVLSDLKSQWPVERVITYTSKTPRPGEVDGRDYHFITPLQFEAKIKEEFFLEWSVAYGTYYGSPRSILDGLKKGRSYITILDRAGARAVSEIVPEAVLIWIHTPTIDILKERLRSRGQDSDASIEKRMDLAKLELEDEAKNKLFRYHILNDNFENAVEEFKVIMHDSLNASNYSKML
ncbi:MAG TPA: guanylate kinase [Candidatus Babeliales bacterium]|nr:guanylate kinase [Candidatus Babeliales bacterium]